MQEQQFRPRKDAAAGSVKSVLLQAAGSKHHYTLTDNLSRKCSIEPHYKDRFFHIKEALIMRTVAGLQMWVFSYWYYKAIVK